MRRSRLAFAALAVAMLNWLSAAVIATEQWLLRPAGLSANWEWFACVGGAAVGLVLAAYFAWSAGPLPALTVLTAATSCTFLNAPRLQTAVGRLAAPGAVPAIAVGWWARRVGDFSCAQAQPHVAMTALLPAAVGWWQRRQDRLTDVDGEGA